MALSLGYATFACVLFGLVSFGHSLDCEWLTAPKGVISTPNFPHSYPVPLRSCYVIKRERHTREKQTKTILYFTQFFLNEVHVESYKNFRGVDSPENSPRIFRKTISAPTRPTSFIIPHLYTVIQVDVKDPVGANLRVPENLMDVYGFNITYEIIDINEKTRLDDNPRVSEPCMKHQCSYNGMCRANANLTSYHCDCFKGFWGPACQYSSRCNEKNKDRCKHATRCEHFMGLTTLLCFCEPGYTGQECDRRYEPNQCREQGCPNDKAQACTSTNDRNARCECEAGNRLVGCECEAGWKKSKDTGKCVRYPVEHLLWEFEYSNETNLETMGEELLNIEHIRNSTLVNVSPHGTASYEIIVTRNHTSEVKNTLKERYGIKHIENEEFVILNVASNKPMPVQEGNTPLVLSCDYRSTVHAEVNWYKDGALVNPLYGPGNVWIERSKRSRSGIVSTYLGLDHVQYIDRGVFTCEISWNGERRRRSLTLDIKMQPSGTLSPSAQNVEYGRPTELWCGIRVYYEELQYHWYKNTVRDDSNAKKQWVPVTFKSLDEEYVEPLHPSRSRLVIPAVRSYAEYKCAIETASFSAEMFSYVFPYTNSSKFCPAEEHMGVSWNRTVVGSFDVQSCTFSTPLKDEAKRMCVEGHDGNAHWAVPDFFDCAFREIYSIRKEILGVTRGYQMTTVVESLGLLADYIASRHDNLLPGEGNHILETLHEVLEYDDTLPRTHPEMKERKTSTLLFLDILSETFNVSNSVSDDRFYAKLNDLIPHVVIKYVSLLPTGTHFHYDNDLFEIEAEVFKVTDPSEGHAAVYKTYSAAMGVGGRVLRRSVDVGGERMILCLLVFRERMLREYLSRLEWIQQRGSRNLLTKLVNFKAATFFEKNQSMVYRTNERTLLNFKLVPPVNTTIRCARIVDGSEVSFIGNEVEHFDNEFVCESRGSSLFALYGEPSQPAPEPKAPETQVLRNACAIIGIFISFTCALSISCTNSSWGLIKCVKLNVCVALLVLFSTALFEASSTEEEMNFPKVHLFRQFCIVVCVAQQLLVMIMLQADPERGFARVGIHTYIFLAITWLFPALLLSTSFGVQQFAETDKFSYLGTLEGVVTVPDASFTSLLIIMTTIYIMILTEVGIASTDPSECRMTTVQKGILKRSILVTFALFCHGITTSAYVQDDTGNLQAVTSVLLALIVFLVYTAYCETDVFYRVVWAHYKKKKEAKSLSLNLS